MKIRHLACVISLTFSTFGYAATPVSCPFTAAELSTALGETFKEGKVGFESDFGTGKTLDCRYSSKNMTLMVKQTVMKDPTQTQGWDRSLAGTKTPVAKDPDGAIQQTDQGDMTSPNLHYARSGDIVELRIMGVGPKSPKFSQLQAALPKLRRLP